MMSDAGRFICEVCGKRTDWMYSAPGLKTCEACWRAGEHQRRLHWPPPQPRNFMESEDRTKIIALYIVAGIVLVALANETAGGFFALIAAIAALLWWWDTPEKRAARARRRTKGEEAQRREPAPPPDGLPRSVGLVGGFFERFGKRVAGRPVVTGRGHVNAPSSQTDANGKAEAKLSTAATEPSAFTSTPPRPRMKMRNALILLICWIIGGGLWISGKVVDRLGAPAIGRYKLCLELE
jgi:hypothetical protein